MIKEPMPIDLLTIDKKEALGAKIIYGYDTLCGWCYGFSDELGKVINALRGEVDFELINGGLFAGIRGPKMGYMSGHIKRNMQNVTDRTGKKFGVNFVKLLDSVNYPYNSMKSSIAIEVVKEMDPCVVFDFASKIQEAFFVEGKDIQSDEVFLELIDGYEIDKQLFIKKLHSDVYENKAQESFFEAQQYGFKGYPASIISIGGETKSLTEGFVTADKFIELIRKELKT